MFPVQISPEAALKETVEFNRKLLRGIDSIANVKEIDIGATPKEEVYREDEMVLYHYIPVKKRLSLPKTLYYLNSLPFLPRPS